MKSSNKSKNTGSSAIWVQLAKIEKDSFSFYGNDCEYYLDVFNKNRQKIGTALAPVVQQGVDYSSAYEFLYDYDVNNEDDRAALAERNAPEELWR